MIFKYVRNAFYMTISLNRQIKRLLQWDSRKDKEDKHTQLVVRFNIYEKSDELKPCISHKLPTETKRVIRPPVMMRETYKIEKVLI